MQNQGTCNTSPTNFLGPHCHPTLIQDPLHQFFVKDLPSGLPQLLQENGNPQSGVVDVAVVIAGNARKNLGDGGGKRV